MDWVLEYNAEKKDQWIVNISAPQTLQSEETGTQRHTFIK